MGVDIYYFYHGFGLKAFEGRTNRIVNREYGCFESFPFGIDMIRNNRIA